MRDHNDSPADTTLSFAWSTPAGRVRAAYRAEVVEYLPSGDRYVCRLTTLLAVERGDGGDIDDATLRGLTGKCVRVPREALDGMTLPLKRATLTGGLARPYFFDLS